MDLLTLDNNTVKINNKDLNTNNSVVYQSSYDVLSSTKGSSNSYYSSLKYAIDICFKTLNFNNYDLYTPLVDNFNYAKEYAENNNYKKCLKHIKVCIKLIDEKKYTLNLSYLYNLLIKINRLIKDKEKKDKLVNLHNEFFESNNNGLDYFYLNNILNVESSNIDYLTLYVEELIILGDYKKAKNCIEMIINNNLNNSKITYLSSVVNQLSNNNYNNVFYKASLSEYISNNDYKSALKLCEKAFNKTKDPFFLYSFGKICIDYDIDYNKGFDMINRCINLSNCYLRECYTYIMFLSYKINNNGMFNSYSDLLYTLYCYDDISIDRDIFNNIVLSYIDKYNEVSVFDISKKILQENEKVKIKRLDY